MKWIVSILFMVMSGAALAANLGLELESVGWGYVYSNDKIKNLHAISNLKNKQQKGFVERRISVLRPGEELRKDQFWKRYCPKLDDQMEVKIDTETLSCTQKYKTENGYAYVYMFAEPRSSKRTNKSFYWNKISFFGKSEYIVPEKVLLKIRSELEKTPY